MRGKPQNHTPYLTHVTDRCLQEMTKPNTNLSGYAMYWSGFEIRPSQPQRISAVAG